MRPNLRRIMLLALVPCALLVAGAELTWPLISNWHGDIGIYLRYASALVAGQVPYRDFAPEYPPLALLPMLLPRLFSGESITRYRLLFLAENTAFLWAATVAMLLLARRMQRPLVEPLVAMCAFALLLSPVLPWRFDMFPALLSVLALLAAQAGARGGWTGLGVAAKLYPAVLGPIFAVQPLVLRRWREFGWLVSGALLALLVSVVPFYLGAGGKLLAFLAYHELRGIQIESVAGGVICLGVVLGQTTALVQMNYGALHLSSPWASAMLPLLTPLLLLAYAALCAWAAWLFWRARGLPVAEQTRLMALLCGAALLVFVVTSKVFSPQYVVWLLPFAPLWRRGPAALFALVCLATVMIFPFHYQALLDLQAWAVLLLNLRNALVLLLLVWLLADTARFQPAA